MAFIYVITNQVNGKQYVGKTNFSLKRRFGEHVCDSRKRRCEKRPLYSAMNKYGIDNFSIEKLEECSVEEANKREQYWIEKLDTYKNGYNATLGGDSKQCYDYREIANKYLELQNQTKTAEYFNCDILTVRTACRECNVPIRTSAEVLKEKYLIYNNKEIADKYLELQSQTETAKYFECSRDVVRKACEEYNIPLKTRAEVIKEKYAIPIYMLDKDTEEILMEFSSLREAAKFILADIKIINPTKEQIRGRASNITQACKGKYKTAYGYKWKYKN